MQRLARNLRRIVGPELPAAEFDALLRRAMRSYARYWMETFRLPSMAVSTIVACLLMGALWHVGDVILLLVSIVIYVSISSFMIWEAWRTLQFQKKRRPRSKIPGTAAKQDESSFSHRTAAIQRFHLWPMISLPTSGVKAISLWVIIGGLFSGFLGGGAGYIRMPMLVYVLGIPTHLAVGTDLFEIIISASYGTFSHAIKGNVDILIALVMHTGAAIGAQIGAISTQYFAGPKIRLAFVPLPLIGAAIVIYTLMTGHKL